MTLILGIESSCDETAAAVVEDGFRVLSSEVASQIAKDAVHGGVVPELAAREHLKALTPVVSGALKQAGVTLKDISAVAVTQGPGLIPALLVGLNYAKGISQINGLPLVGVNHFLAHIYGAFLDSPPDIFADESLYPLLALVVSGGHTSLMLIDKEGKARQLGCTIDDAAGEALDKGAKLLDLGYPGGPVIQKVAQGGDPEKFRFPRPLTGGAGKPVAPENRFNFSFSGIKTALLYHSQKYPGIHCPGRFVMTCCENDITFYGLIAHGEELEQFTNRDWVEVTARMGVEEHVAYDGPGPVLYVQSIARC